jgi:membrane-associated protease RseP (regulator of RpoE activity)
MMKVFRLLAILVVPVLAYAAGDSTEVRRGWLGVYTDELSKPTLVALDIDHGVLVTDVAEESPAAKAGIEVGDVITLLDGQATTDGSALRWVVRDRPDKKVVVKVHRRGKDKKLSVTLGVREGAEKTFNFEWPAMPREALREAERALQEAGPSLKRELDRSDLSLDSLREEMGQLKKELNELRKKLTEKPRSE